MLICNPVLQRPRKENLESDKGLDGTGILSLKKTKNSREIGGGGVGEMPKGITESLGPGTFSTSVSKPPILRAIYLSGYKNNFKTLPHPPARSSKNTHYQA